MAAFEKGREKTGGRAKGTPNKTTTDLKEWVFRLVSKNTKQIEKDLKELDAKERLILFEKLLRYVLPRQASITADMAFGFDEKEVEQFRAWQRTNARYEAMTDEELQAEIERMQAITSNL